MRFLAAIVSISMFASPMPASAQHGGVSLATAGAAPKEVSQYDFLVGDWDLSIKVPPPNLAARIHGMPKMVASWRVRKALDGWGLEDDLRITDEAGNPSSLLHSVRYYDRSQKRWVISSLDVYRGRFMTATGDWRGNMMVLASSGKDANGKAYISRTRIYDITPTSFRFQQDRSQDQGKTWQEGTLKMEARRVGTKSG